MSEETARLLAIAVPALIAAFTLIGGALVYAWQRRIDRHNQILKERRALYREFVSLAQKVQIAHRMNDYERSRGDYIALKVTISELMVTAPDGVATGLNEFDNSITKLLHESFTKKKPEALNKRIDNNPLLKDVVDSFAYIVLMMRKDTFGKTGIVDVAFVSVGQDLTNNAEIASLPSS